MKALLVFLLIAAVSANEFTVSNNSIAVDFIKGFLEGLGEQKAADEILKCVTNIEGILNEVYEAIQLIMKLTFQDIVNGVTKLIAAITKFNQVIEPCSKGYEVVEKLIAAIYNADFNKVLQKFTANMIALIGHITAAAGCFSSGNYKCAGSNIGTILKLLFLSETFDEATKKIHALDFLKGFIAGLGGNFNEKDFEPCVKDVEAICAAIKEAFDAIITGNFNKILEGVGKLIQAAKQLMNDIKSCAKGVEVIQKLIEAIVNIDILKVATKIIANFGKIVDIISTTVPCFTSGDYYCIGKGFGSLLKTLLFD